MGFLSLPVLFFMPAHEVNALCGKLCNLATVLQSGKKKPMVCVIVLCRVPKVLLTPLTLHKPIGGQDVRMTFEPFSA